MSIKNFQKDEEDIHAEINVTPLIDIMLVLLIIFMVTSSITVESGLDIDLPKTTSKTNKAGPQAVVVTLDATGTLFVQGKSTSWEFLGESISKALKNSQEATVVLQGDQKSTLGRAIEIMDVARKAGAQKFAVAAEGKN